MIRPVGADGRIETGGAFTPIRRPRIVDRIASAATQRIVLIIAPAGYGKSVALRQYLTEMQEQHVLFNVRPDHANLLGFLRGFSEAVEEFAPDARKTVSSAYEKSGASKTPGSDLAMWMHAHLKTYTGIISIDDLHLAESDPEISRFLVALMERTKGRARWIIASRSSLDLPVGSWLAYGDMDLAVDEQDLRFTIEEARLTAKASRVGVREEELSELVSMTEGWPTALSFALRSSTRSVDLRNIAASTREMVYRYLAEQVYESLEDDERDLLHFISYLPEVRLEVLRRAGYARATALIEAIRDRVAFIYPERPGVYRCHDLFREFLRHQLELQGDAEVLRLQQRVASTLEQGGDIPHALELYIAMRAHRETLRVLTAHGFSLLDHAHSDVVTLALHSLSDEARAKSAIVLALRAQRESDAGRFDRAESLFRRAIELAQGEALAADFKVRLASMLFNQGRDVVALLEPVAASDNLPPDARAQATSFLAPAYAFANRVEEALQAMRRTEDFARTVESDQLRARLHHRVGIAGVQLHRPLEEVEHWYSRAQAAATASGMYFTAASAFTGLGNVAALYEDDAAKTAWCAQQAINCALKAGDRISLQNALLLLIDVETRRGNQERITALERQFTELTTTDAARTMYILPTRAIAAAWQSRFDEALRLMTMVPENAFHSFEHVMCGALHSLYALAEGKRELAVRLSGSTLQEADTTISPYVFGQRVIEVARLMCAVCEAMAGRLTNAQRILAARPRAEGPSASAMREVAQAVCKMMKNPALGTDVAEALEQLAAVGWGGFAAILRNSLERVSPEEGREGSPLTPSELEVLEALAQGNSPKDIALESGRSIYTIQAHIRNIIKKLGCRGRSEALTVARRNGLIKFN